MNTPFFPCENISVNETGHLCFGGQDTAALAARFGTPLYLLDEDRIRNRCRLYSEAFRISLPAGSLPLYAGKANCFRGMYRIIREEGLGIDVVSAGEIYTAASAGFDMSLAYFHGSNKTDEDIRFAMDCGVGCFIVDNRDELLMLEQEAERRGVRQRILLRLTPGIDTHTYEAVNTGKVDSKFGVAIETGQAEKFTVLALAQKNLDLCGFHCHVGSQVFEEDVFERSAVIMLEFIAEMNARYGYAAAQLDLGGGYGVRYVEGDPSVDIAAKIASVGETVRAECARLGIPEPAILMEPGRSIVADAGMTLYTVGAVKRIPGYKNYVSIDGGMSDNPRNALYGSRYTCLPADRMAADCAMRCDLVGRCCESGDVITPGISMPEDIARGDLVAVCTTGAYNYSMASNYNRIPRPPVVLLRGGEATVAVRRETLADLLNCDL